MAPVRRTLVATWKGVGSSVVANMDCVSSTGPSSWDVEVVVVVVVGSWTCASHDGWMEGLVGREMVGLWRNLGL